MSGGSFRSIVREELVMWMDKNRNRFDILNSRILEQLAPIVTEQLERGIMARLEQVEPDEREQIAIVLEHTRDFISRYGLAKPTATDQADVILSELDGAIRKLQAPPRPKGS